MAAQGPHKKLPFQEKPHFNSPGTGIPELSPCKHRLQPLPAPKPRFVRKQSIIPFFDISDDKVQEQIKTAPVQLLHTNSYTAVTQNSPKPRFPAEKGNLEMQNGHATGKGLPVSISVSMVLKSWFSSQDTIKQIILLFHARRDTHASIIKFSNIKSCKQQ